MLSIVLSISMSATPTTSTTTDRWRAFAAEHEAARDWCEASFYRARVLDESKLHDDVYRAFLAAYAADQLQTARTLLDTLKLDELDLTDDARKKIARIQLDLETVTPLEDATCAPHQGVCGDAIVDVGETCDDGNTDAHDGCSATCTLEPPPPIVHMTTTTEPPPARPEHVEVAHTAPMSGLVIGGGVAAGAGVVTAAAGTMLALASDHTIGDPTSTGPEKAKALPERTASWIAAGVGLGAAAGGVVAIMLANDESK